MDDYQDVWDVGMEFHYSWIIILVALVGWKNPKYTMFLQINRRWSATQYESLWHSTVAKDIQENTDIFNTYLEEIQGKVEETWRIPPKVVEQYKTLANFKYLRHNMWI
jgi:hypothetical protein